MAKKLYVGGLSYSTTQDALRDAFAQTGTVESATVITDKMSGRSKGFGFVEMSSDEEAQKAIEMWNGKELDGLQVDNLAVPITGPDVSMRDAFDFAKQVSAKKIIPIHYDVMGAKPDFFIMLSTRFKMPFEIHALNHGESLEI